ncbi:MAG: ATP-binding protein [Nitrospirota bacterium]
MRLNIFSRLIIGYLTIFILVAAVSVYAFLQLQQFETVTHQILNVDNRIVDYEKKLTDSLLSQMRYERKYIIVKDDTLYDQFLLAKVDFIQYLEKAMLLLDTPQKRDLLKRVKANYERYNSLFDEEVEYVRANERYQQDFYQQEKEKAVNEITEELKNLKVFSEQSIYDKIKKLGEAGAIARNVVLIMAITSILWGIVISFFITRSITKPLSVMIDKTREISEGVLKSDLALSSPPEIAELSKAFNSMCHKLKMVDKMKSDFFASMSHELRTPLSSIKEGSSLLLEGLAGELSEDQKRLTLIISEESDRLIALVNSILDLSRMEAGMMTFNFTLSNITPLIRKAVNEIEPLAVAKNINLDIDTTEELPNIRMDCDRILQALRNLIGNAVKFTPEEGYIKISAGLINRNLKVTVNDTGPGIPKENLSTIFEKFRQAPATNLHQIKGTGLGLALVKHIITAHGGKVWAESDIGKGSSFIFVLPA